MARASVASRNLGWNSVLSVLDRIRATCSFDAPPCPVTAILTLRGTESSPLMRPTSTRAASEPEVVDIEENEDGTVTLTVNAVSEGMMDDAVLTHRLTVRFTDGGGIEFLKNEVEGDALERMPDYVYRIQES